MTVTSRSVYAAKQAALSGQLDGAAVEGFVDAARRSGLRGGEPEVRQLYPREATAEDALMAFDRDLMIRDGWPRAAAEHLALRHARDRALNQVQADLEAG